MNNDDTRDETLQAIDHAEKAVGRINGPLTQQSSAIASSLMQAKTVVEKAIREQLMLTATIGASRLSADMAFAGSRSDNATEAMGLILQSEEDSKDNIAKLRVMEEQLDRMARDIVPVYTEENERVAGKLRSAISYLRGYLNNL